MKATDREQQAMARPATILESIDDDMRKILELPGTAGESLHSLGPVEIEERFRPQQRPPMALLHVLDDRGELAELVRVRAASLVIGRTEGDVKIPHDSQISSRHAEIVRSFEKGRYVWTLKDLGSTNGTFVRASQVVLKHGQMLLIGGGRFRFEIPERSESAAPPAVESEATSAWRPTSKPAEGPLPELVEVLSNGDGVRYPMLATETWIGRSPQTCSIVLDDPQVAGRHARIYRDDRRRWCVEHIHSLNGLWTQVDKMAMGKGGQFQCGEQRFLLKVL